MSYRVSIPFLPRVVRLPGLLGKSQVCAVTRDFVIRIRRGDRLKAPDFPSDSACPEHDTPTAVCKFRFRVQQAMKDDRFLFLRSHPRVCYAVRDTHFFDTADADQNQPSVWY